MFEKMLQSVIDQISLSLIRDKEVTSGPITIELLKTLKEHTNDDVIVAKIKATISWLIDIGEYDTNNRLITLNMIQHIWR